MNTISSPQKGDANSERTSEEAIQESIRQHHHEVNMADGAEFLDDAIRMNDQPLVQNACAHLVVVGETTVTGNE
jgi:hypothetical protein